MTTEDAGLVDKYRVARTDGRSAPGERHDGCSYFVLDLTHDRHTVPALRAYADAVRLEQPRLAADLDALVVDSMARFDWTGDEDAGTASAWPDEPLPGFDILDGGGRLVRREPEVAYDPETAALEAPYDQDAEVAR